MQLVLLALALGFFSLTTRQYPLVDADEATYAYITDRMLQTGDIWTLERVGGDWLEKPPLLLWMSAASVKLFGQHEFAYRLPSVFASVLTLWFVFRIVRNLNGSLSTATVAFLALLFAPQFYAFGREVRLDPGVVFSIVLALYFLTVGWQKEKYYLGIFPALAVGVLFKSMIAGIFVPLAVIFSMAYGEWRWLKSKYLWWGLLPAALIAAPWHIVQSLRFGWEFWKIYALNTFFQHTGTTIAGSADSFLYLKTLWHYNVPWTYTILALLGLVAASKFWKEDGYKINKGLWASFFSALFIILLFSFFRTHLSTYILPAFPFLAIFIAFAVFDLAAAFKISEKFFVLVCIPLLAVGAIYSLKTVGTLVTPLHYQERDAGLVLHRLSRGVPVYVLDWPFLETLSYYGGKQLKILSVKNGGEELNGPFAMITNPAVMTYFYNREGRFMAGYENTREIFRGEQIVVIYSENDLVLPKFSYRD